MIKTVFTLLLAMGCIGMQAQSDFATLPAKVRTEMAEKEEIASEQDQEFQRLMSQGMEHFEDGEFEAALQSFEQAGQRRPLNVYPPVMVADVELSMELEAKAAKQEEPEVASEPEPEQSQAPEMTADERVALMYEAEMRKVRGELPPPPPPVEPEVKEPMPVKDKEGIIIEAQDESEELVEEITDEIQETKTEIEEEAAAIVEEVTKTPEKVKKDRSNKEERAPVGPIKIEEQPKKEVEKVASKPIEDGMIERRFKEGNKDIFECLLTKDGKTINYREVKHNWGGVFYFKDGESISKREWDEEIPQ